MLLGAALLGEPLPPARAVGAAVSIAVRLHRRLPGAPRLPLLEPRRRRGGTGAQRGVFYLIPLFGSLLAVVLLGERLAAYHAVGAGLILGGVALASRRL